MANKVEYHDNLVRTLELIWGEGYMAPGCTAPKSCVLILSHSSSIEPWLPRNDQALVKMIRSYTPAFYLCEVSQI